MGCMSCTFCTCKWPSSPLVIKKLLEHPNCFQVLGFSGISSLHQRQGWGGGSQWIRGEGVPLLHHWVQQPENTFLLCQAFSRQSCIYTVVYFQFRCMLVSAVQGPKPGQYEVHLRVPHLANARLKSISKWLWKALLTEELYKQQLPWETWLWKAIKSYLTTGILVSDKVTKSNISALLFSFSLGEPAHCFEELSNSTDSSLFSSSLRWSCIVWRRKVTCLKKEKWGNVADYESFFSGDRIKNMQADL